MLELTDSVGSTTHHSCDIGSRQAIDQPHPDDRLVVGRKRHQRRQQPSLLVRCQRLSFWTNLMRREFQRIVEWDRRVATLAPSIANQVECDLFQPGMKGRARGPIGRERSKRAQDRLLCQVLRLGGVPERGVRKRIDRPPLSAAQLIQSVPVTSLCPFQQSVVGHAVPSCQQ